MHLENPTFKTIIEATPLVSIDLVVTDSSGQYLLGLRRNKPAQGYWFVPGGRIYKNETMDSAFTRLCKVELGLDILLSDAEFLGPFEHFYKDCVFGDEVSTHYVVLGYKIMADISISDLPNEQHDDYKWFTRDQILKDSRVHKHSKWYV
jgi:colanic acid biosynthesis protein WcaH